VRFRIDGEVRHASACHCVQCRKTSGHYWAALNVAQDDLVIEQGTESLAWYPNPEGTVERGFCVICGSPLFWRRVSEAVPDVAVSLGAIEGETGLVLEAHIFTEEKGDYYRIADGVPTHARADP
jgi:hypothetical protein